MKDPKRHLQKILNMDTAGLDRLESAGEDLALLVETLQEVRQCRKARQFLRDEFRLDPVVSPAGFDDLLVIPEIDIVEVTTKMGEVDRSSIKAKRNPRDPVSVAHLNVILRELNRDLVRLQDQIDKEYPNLLLAGEMDKDLVDTVAARLAAIRKLNLNVTGYLFTGWKAKQIERAFRQTFPLSEKAHSLRTVLDELETELVFYKRCLQVNQKWGPLSLDLFYIFRHGALPRVIQNVQQLGSALWNVVYNSQQLKQSIELVGIRFSDVRTLFDAENLR